MDIHGPASRDADKRKKKGQRTTKEQLLLLFYCCSGAAITVELFFKHFILLPSQRFSDLK